VFEKRERERKEREDVRRLERK